MNFLYPTIYFICGITAITLLDTFGAIASRRYNFKYASLLIPSLLLYIFIGFLSSRRFGINVALFINALIGFYDGTIGFWLCIKFKGVGTEEEKVQNFLGIKSAVYMV